MVCVPDAETVAFMGGLVHRFPVLMPVLQEHIEDQDREVLPHLLIADICRWLVARFVERGPEDDLLLGILDALEDQFGRSDPTDNLIAASFLEHLPYVGEIGDGIRTLLGPNLKAQLRRSDGGELRSAGADHFAFNPCETYLDLLDGGALEVIPITPDFWPSLISGKREIKGRLAGANRLTRDIDHWEMHPAGDEWLIRLSGAFDVVLDEAGVTRRARLDAATCCCVVPKGTWHTIEVREPGELLFVTPGAGTQHRPA